MDFFEALKEALKENLSIEIDSSFSICKTLFSCAIVIMLAALIGGTFGITFATLFSAF